MPLPTPSQAAQARTNQGFLGNLGHIALTRTPYLGPAYNAASTIAHILQGTTGQFGPPTSLVGRFLAALGGNPTNAPRATAVGPVQQGVVAQPGQPLGNSGGQTPGDTTDPSNPNNYQLGGGIPTRPPVPGALSTNNQWNAWRSPFSQTYQQAMNPGSAIGPFGGGIQNPYNPASTHGTPNSHVQGLPADAAAFRQWIMSRNQL